MHAARCQVVQNKGSAGTDGMPVSKLYNFMQQHRDGLALAILKGEYLPQAIKGVEILKSKGKTRLLGVPTVTDRWLPQYVAQAIGPLFELEFSNYSYGLRPGKNAQQCLQQAQSYINEGYRFTVDIDLKSFFVEVEHCLLLQLVYRKVKCPHTLRLIRKWLRAPIQIKGKLVRRRKGVPQGSPLSPLLSNILLHELDKELEKQGCSYVRYADDISIYCKSKPAARSIGNKVYLFLKNRLRLPINREKCGIRKPLQFQLLGHGFVASFAKGDRGKYQPVASEQSWQTLKHKLNAITRKTTPSSFCERVARLKEVQRGWLQYFCMASISGKLRELDKWVRNRLRYCIWHDWKKPDRRRRNLIQLGVQPGQAYAWSRTRMGGWAVAQSPILIYTVTLKRLVKRGYESMRDYYKQIAPQFNEPLYTRPVRTVV